MAAPPVEVGYWMGGLAFTVVMAMLFVIFREHFNHSRIEQRIMKERCALMGAMVAEPVAFLSDSVSYTFTKSQWLAFTVDPNDSSVKMTKCELELIKSILIPADVDVEGLIPNGTVAISFAFNGFSFGDGCLDFRPSNPSNTGSLKFQMVCSRVQAVYFMEKLAGVCIYFGSSMNESEEPKKKKQVYEEYEYNIFTFYDIIQKKRREEARESRRAEKKERRERMEKYDPTGEFTSSAYSHLKLCTQKDGRPVVLACNAEGKLEKYAFNEKVMRYEYVEIEENEEELGNENNYLLGIY